MADILGPVYFSNKLKDEIISGPTSPIKEALYLKEVQVGNGSGGNASVSFGYKLIDSKWKAGLWDDSADPAYIDDTTDAQDAGTGDFALTTTTNNDGFVFQASEPFNAVGLTISTAQTGSPVYEYTYWNGASWASLTRLESPSFTATGDTYLVFNQPPDWAPLAATDDPVATEGLTAGYYAIRMRATTAPSQAVVASIAWVVKFLDYVKTIADGSAAVKTSQDGLRVPAGHEVVCYCSTASSANWVLIEYTKKP